MLQNHMHRVVDKADRVKGGKLVRPNFHRCLIRLCKQGDGGGRVFSKVR